MRNLLVGMMLVLFSMPLSAAEKNQPITTFTIQSVSISGDECTLSAKDVGGDTYYATGYAWLCENMRTGEKLSGYISSEFFLFGNPSRVTYLRLENGLTKKGKIKWNLFVVSSHFQ